jgi:hypothetical protein
MPIEFRLQRVEIAKLATAVTSRGMAKVPTADLAGKIAWRNQLLVGVRRRIRVHQREIRDGLAAEHVTDFQRLETKMPRSTDVPTPAKST